MTIIVIVGKTKYAVYLGMPGRSLYGSFNWSYWRELTGKRRYGIGLFFAKGDAT